MWQMYRVSKESDEQDIRYTHAVYMRFHMFAPHFGGGGLQKLFQNHLVGQLSWPLSLIRKLARK